MKENRKIEELLQRKGKELAVPGRLEPKQMHKVLKEYEKNRRGKKYVWKKRLYPALTAAACFFLAAGVLVWQQEMAALPPNEGSMLSKPDKKMAAEEQITAEPAKEEQKQLECAAGSYEEIYARLSGNWKVYDAAAEEEMTFGSGVEELEAADSGSVERKLQTSDEIFGRTNTRTEQVDEADQIKNDGRYLYQIARKQSEDEGSAVPAGLQILDTKDGLREAVFLDDFESLEEFYVWEDLLITIENKYYDDTVSLGTRKDGTAVEDAVICGSLCRERGYHEISIYEITDRNQPRKRKTFTLQGTYESSRISDGYFYGISRFHAEPGNGEQDYDAYIPSLDGRRMGAEQIYCPEESEGTSYLVLVSIDLSDPYSFADSCAVLAGAGTYYVSTGNIYVAWYRSIYGEEAAEEGKVRDTTRLLRFSYGKGRFYAQAEGEVPGNAKNSFSMDEYEGNFRIAVTVQEYEVKEIWDDRTGKRLGFDYGEATETNAVYILNPALDVAGRLEGLAEGETIRSVRFFGEICYFVTFRQTDPLFAVDLSDQDHPKVLGELKVSGFSEYLHFYGEDLLLGIGMEADEETGQEQGMKISMFDISDPKEVREVSRYRLEDYDYSEALWDHRAVLIDVGENIIGFGAEGWRNNKYQREYFLFSYQGDTFVQDLKVDADLQDQNFCTVRGTFIGDMFYLLLGNGSARAYERNTGALISEL